MDLEVTPKAKEIILANSYDVEFGARPVKRFLQTNVETKLGKMIIEGKIGAKETAILDLDENNQLVFHKNSLIKRVLIPKIKKLNIREFFIFSN